MDGPGRDPVGTQSDGPGRFQVRAGVGEQAGTHLVTGQYGQGCKPVGKGLDRRLHGDPDGLPVEGGNPLDVLEKAVEDGIVHPAAL